MEAETGVMLPKEKEFLDLPKGGRSKEGSSPGGFRRRMVLPKHLDFRFLASRTVGK